MLPLLGALALEGIDTAVIVNVLRYGLLTLGASALLGKKEKKEPLKKDIFETSKETADIFVSKEKTEKESNTQQKTKETTFEETKTTDENSTLSDQVSGDTLLDVLRSSGVSTSQGLLNISSSIDTLNSSVNSFTDTLLEQVTKFKEDFGKNQEKLLNSLQGLGVVLGAIALSLEGIRNELRSLNASNSKPLDVRLVESIPFSPKVSVNADLKLPEVFKVKLENEILPIDLPKEIKESANSTKKVMDTLLNPIKVDFENARSEGTPIEILTQASGIQAKTFADINSFDAEADIPDLGDGIDISQIFKFLRVSSQIKG